MAVSDNMHTGRTVSRRNSGLEDAPFVVSQSCIRNTLLKSRIRPNRKRKNLK